MFCCSRPFCAEIAKAQDYRLRSGDGVYGPAAKAFNKPLGKLTPTRFEESDDREHFTLKVPQELRNEFLSALDLFVHYCEIERDKKKHFTNKELRLIRAIKNREWEK